MVSWTIELAEAILDDPSKVTTIMGVSLAEGFPNHPVRHFVLPTTLSRLRRDPAYGVWSGLIIHPAEHVAIGSMGFKAPPDNQGAVEIGYDIAPAYQGNGYATEMARAFVNWGLEQTSVRRITAECLPDNAPSIRVLEKIGMHLVTANDEMLYWELPVPE